MHEQPDRSMECGRKSDHNGDHNVAHCVEISALESRSALSPSAVAAEKPAVPFLNPYQLGIVPDFVVAPTVPWLDAVVSPCGAIQQAWTRDASRSAAFGSIGPCSITQRNTSFKCSEEQLKRS